MKTPQQQTLFGSDTPVTERFDVYHDESGHYVPHGPGRWLFHGVLFVPERKESEATVLLRAARDRSQYYGEVHFKKIQKRNSPKGFCARRWIEDYVSCLSEYCYFHCLAIDTHSPKFEHDRFGEAYHAYNYFLKVALVGGIAWSLSKYKQVALTLYSDGKGRQHGDNFTTYIPRAVQERISEKHRRSPTKYPSLNVSPKVILLDSNPRRCGSEFREKVEFLQMADLLTSAVAQAVTASSGLKGKIELAQMLAHLVQDSRLPPWLQKEGMHRCFNVSAFPGPKGEFYNCSLSILDRNALRLFDGDDE